MNTNDINLRRLNITTGNVLPNKQTTSKEAPKNGAGETFTDILSRSLGDSTSNVSFSKHAQNRVVERNIDLAEGNTLERLSEGVELANEKGLGDTLVLVDSTAFIVNAKNGTVITTISGDDLQKNVFTNIEGTVIV